MSVDDPDTEALSLPPNVVQVGRQPILDRNLRIYGYELLYRSQVGIDGVGGDRATARTVMDGFLEFGLHRLVGSHRAFVNVTECFFSGEQDIPIDNNCLVIEVLESIELSEAVVTGVKRWRERGFTIALDDYRFESRWDPLLPHCDIVKVEILGLDLETYRAEIAHLKSLGLTLLAEKVETRKEFERAKGLGFDLFQGFFFARPQTLSTARSQNNKSLMLKMIAKVNDPDSELEEIASLVELDPNLSYKILRVLNSAAVALPRKVISIHQAVIYIGIDRLRAWTTLFLMAGLDMTSSELITTSLLRAELCRALSRELHDDYPESSYTVGLLSTLDAMLDRPMSELLEDLPLPAPMIDALLSHRGPLGDELQCAIDLEHCQWMSEATQLLPVERLNTLYVQALERVETLRSTIFQHELI
ncbi:MAG: HDOD domain-containing protein [Candidatus Thiodiazotropha sp.]